MRHLLLSLALLACDTAPPAAAAEPLPAPAAESTAEAPAEKAAPVEKAEVSPTEAPPVEPTGPEPAAEVAPAEPAAEPIAAPEPVPAEPAVEPPAPPPAEAPPAEAPAETPPAEAEPAPAVESPEQPSVSEAAPVVGAEPVAEAEPVEEPAGLHDPFDAILKATVRSERVDYAAIRDTHRAALGAYLDTLAATDVGALPRNEKLALYINLYNATMLAAIADRYRPGYAVSENEWGIFDEPLVRLKSGTISLNDLEHKRVRPMGDARIHAALVCGAVSCPPLTATAFTADNLSSRLARNTRRWINDAGRNAVDVEGQTLQLSAIFDWYADDFGGKDALPAYVDRYLEADVSGYAVTFMAYDWSLNAR